MDNKIAGNRVLEHLMFANTPRSLFEALRRTSEVLYWSTDAPLHELIARFHALVANPERTMEDVATAYAILVAVGMKTGEDAAAALQSLPAQQLEWGPTFRDLIRTTIPSVNSKTVKFRSAAHRASISQTDSTTQSKTLELECTK